MSHSILYSFRLFRNWEQSYVATKLMISLEEYKDLESGLNNVDVETALKLSELYKAPPHFFLVNNPCTHLSVIYSHCHFENSNGYVNHLYQHDGELIAKEETIRMLKEEVKLLREQNNQLIALIK